MRFKCAFLIKFIIYSVNKNYFVTSNFVLLLVLVLNEHPKVGLVIF